MSFFFIHTGQLWHYNIISLASSYIYLLPFRPLVKMLLEKGDWKALMRNGNLMKSVGITETPLRLLICQMPGKVWNSLQFRCDKRKILLNTQINLNIYASAYNVKPLVFQRDASILMFGKFRLHDMYAVNIDLCSLCHSTFSDMARLALGKCREVKYYEDGRNDEVEYTIEFVNDTERGWYMDPHSEYMAFLASHNLLSAIDSNFTQRRDSFRLRAFLYLDKTLITMWYLCDDTDRCALRINF